MGGRFGGIIVITTICRHTDIALTQEDTLRAHTRAHIGDRLWKRCITACCPEHHSLHMETHCWEVRSTHQTNLSPLTVHANIGVLTVGTRQSSLLAVRPNTSLIIRLKCVGQTHLYMWLLTRHLYSMRLTICVEALIEGRAGRECFTAQHCDFFKRAGRGGQVGRL